jgi:hypothetical protein
VPTLRGSHRVGPWTVLVYDRWLHLGINRGLLLDEIVDAEQTGESRRLDACLSDVLGHYHRVMNATVRRARVSETIGKLYGDRVATGGRLDRYYLADQPWHLGHGRDVRPSRLADLTTIVNGRELTVDFADTMNRIRQWFAPPTTVWAAVTQGDPTDLNIGWSPTGGPIWFDYDTGGLNALAGEFACFLMYQRLHGAWLTPRHNPHAFRDHPAALAHTTRPQAAVHIGLSRTALAIDHQHAASSARQHVMRRYLDMIIRPLTRQLDVPDVMAWLRPYLVMRVLGVYGLGTLAPDEVGVSLALLAEALDPATTLPAFLALSPTFNEATTP